MTRRKKGTPIFIGDTLVGYRARYSEVFGFVQGVEDLWVTQLGQIGKFNAKITFENRKDARIYIQDKQKGQ